MRPKDISKEAAVCRNARDTVAFWRANSAHAAEHVTESLWVLALDKDRHFMGCHEVQTRVFRSPALLADEILSAEMLKGAPEFIFIHSRPGATPEATEDDKQRARAIILAGRAKESELLDYIIIGRPDKRFKDGVFGLAHFKKAFRSDNPFPPKNKRRLHEHGFFKAIFQRAGDRADGGGFPKDDSPAGAAGKLAVAEAGEPRQLLRSDEIHAGEWRGVANGSVPGIHPEPARNAAGTGPGGGGEWFCA